MDSCPFSHPFCLSLFNSQLQYGFPRLLREAEAQLLELIKRRFYSKSWEYTQLTYLMQILQG